MFIKKLRRSRAAVVGVCCALVGAAAVPVISLAGSITGSTGDGPLVLQSGESSVTYQAQSNVGGLVATAYKQIWQRVGDTVSVTGAIPVTPSSAGSASVYIPVPAAADSNITSRFDCVGNASVNSTTGVAGRIFGSEVAGHSHQCVVEWPAPSGGTQQWVHYTMHYRVRD
jgi:hypothetical protein